MPQQRIRQVRNSCCVAPIDTGEIAQRDSCGGPSSDELLCSYKKHVSMALQSLLLQWHIKCLLSQEDPVRSVIRLHTSGRIGFDDCRISQRRNGKSNQATNDPIMGRRHATAFRVQAGNGIRVRKKRQCSIAEDARIELLRDKLAFVDDVDRYDDLFLYVVIAWFTEFVTTDLHQVVAICSGDDAAITFVS